MVIQKLIASAILIFQMLLPGRGMAPAALPAGSTPTPEGHQVHVYLFWGLGCPHCARAKPFLESMAEKYPQVVYREFEIYENAENRELFSQMAAASGFEVSGVPTMFIGPYYSVGYAEDINQDIEDLIQQCINEGCADAGAGIVPAEAVQPATPTPAAALETPLPTLTSTAVAITVNTVPPAVTPTAAEQSGSVSGALTVSGDQQLAPSNRLTLPLIGTVNLEEQSLALSTALIALVDGFNPCSLWVLSMLMALVLHTGSRKKVLLIGLIFLTVTAAIYALFIAGLFSVLRLVSFMGWVQVLVAGVALVFGLINIKDYFWFKSGVSLTISEKHRPGIFQSMRRVLASGDSILALAGATVVMAAGVSLVEFSCTAGFPVLWTNLLVSQGVEGGAFFALLMLYLVIYQVDELIIFGSMVVTLKASRLEEKEGRLLKLFGGVLMLALAAVMLIDPALMNDLGTSALIFGMAFILAGVILIVHRKILPHFGVWIGSEKPTEKRHRRHG